MEDIQIYLEMTGKNDDRPYRKLMEAIAQGLPSLKQRKGGP